MTLEHHPLEPFLPENARLLFLGSFPPPRQRWCMDFYYPNFQNDHWRIEGAAWFGDRNYFVDGLGKCFLKDKIVEFLQEKGIALYDTARTVNRLKDNASDAFLEIVEPTDIRALLQQIPLCRAIATTGEKATETICSYFGISVIPKVNTAVALPLGSGEGATLYRLPSSSRAYPLAFEKKVEAYKALFQELFNS